MMKDYKQIIVEFQRELKGELDENPERISRGIPGQISGKFLIPRWLRKNYRRIVGGFKEEIQENSRDNYLGIPGIFLEEFGRDLGGIRKEFGRLPEGFLGTCFTILVLALFHWPLDPLGDGHVHSWWQENQIHCRSFHCGNIGYGVSSPQIQN